MVVGPVTTPSPLVPPRNGPASGQVAKACRRSLLCALLDVMAGRHLVLQTASVSILIVGVDFL